MRVGDAKGAPAAVGWELGCRSICWANQSRQGSRPTTPAPLRAPRHSRAQSAWVAFITLAASLRVLLCPALPCPLPPPPPPPQHSLVALGKSAPTLRQLFVCGSPVLATAIPDTLRGLSGRIRRLTDLQLPWLPVHLPMFDSPAVRTGAACRVVCAHILFVADSVTLLQCAYRRVHGVGVGTSLVIPVHPLPPPPALPPPLPSAPPRPPDAAAVCAPRRHLPPHAPGGHRGPGAVVDPGGVPCGCVVFPSPVPPATHAPLS